MCCSAHNVQFQMQFTKYMNRTVKYIMKYKLNFLIPKYFPNVRNPTTQNYWKTTSQVFARHKSESVLVDCNFCVESNPTYGQTKHTQAVSAGEVFNKKNQWNKWKYLSQMKSFRIWFKVMADESMTKNHYFYVWTKCYDYFRIFYWSLPLCWTPQFSINSTLVSFQMCVINNHYRSYL